MKIVRTKEPISAEKLKAFLETKLSDEFKQRRHVDIDFIYTLTTQGVQITQPDLYEDFLFRMEIVSDNELHITKSEHYTDDVNVLTLEDILNSLLMEFPGRDNIDFIEEQS